MTRADDVWASFSRDPRLDAHAALRASDGDRDVVHQLLTEAYADGRLDRDELDARSEQTAAARTLGQLPPLIADLVATDPLSSGALVPAGDLQQRAVAKYRSDRREALMGFLAPSIICVVIWLIINNPGYADAFFWPGFVIAGTGINLLRTLVRREDMVEEHIRRLEKKQAKRRPEDGTE